MPYRNRFPANNVPPLVVHGGLVTRAQIQNVLIACFEHHKVRDRYLHTFFGDRRYFVLTRPSIDELLGRCFVPQAYIPERFDCEDFARVFIADAIRHVSYDARAGLCIAKGSFTYNGGAHAVNLIFEWKRNERTQIGVHFFEPIRHRLMTMAQLKEDYGDVSFYHVSI